jgi:hypothetical protein
MMTPREMPPLLAVFTLGRDSAIRIAARDLARQGARVVLCVEYDCERRRAMTSTFRSGGRSM